MCCERILHVSTRGVSPPAPRERELARYKVRTYGYGYMGRDGGKKWASEASPTSCNIINKMSFAPT